MTMMMMNYAIMPIVVRASAAVAELSMGQLSSTQPNPTQPTK